LSSIICVLKLLIPSINNSVGSVRAPNKNSKPTAIMTTETKKSWLKSNIVMIPVVASILVGTFTGVRYVVTLTETINANKIEIMNMQRDMLVIKDSNTDLKQRLARAEGTWEMAENLYRELAEKVRDMAWDIKDLSREVNGN